MIPARGGSKGIPRKNLALLGGKPLLFWTIREALRSKRIGRVIVSTDDGAIAVAAMKFGAQVPFVRPAALSNDKAPMAGVLRHALSEMEKRGEAYDAVVLLQPTSPFRTAAHIDATLRRLEASRANAAVTVVDVPHNFSPDSALVERGGRLVPVRKGPPVLRRQDKKSYVARNGPAVLALRADQVRTGRLYAGKIVGVKMSALESLDIDGPDDLLLAEAVLRMKHRR